MGVLRFRLVGGLGGEGGRLGVGMGSGVDEEGGRLGRMLVRRVDMS